MSGPKVSLAHLRPTVRYTFKASPGHEGQTLDDLAAKMRDIGNPVLGMNHAENYILCAQMTEADERWGCLLCLNDGQLSLLDTEDELRNHLAANHPGWEQEAGLYG